MRHSQILVLLPATILAFATLASRVSAQAPKIRDSVGIRIVENASRLNAPIAFTLGAKPNFDVGALENEPEKEFHQKQSYFQGIRLSDGRVAITDKTRIQYFDASGKRIKITGRSGQGPGEFDNLSFICRTRGDTVFAVESKRVSVLDQTGAYVGLSNLPAEKWAENMFCFDDGTLLTISFLGKTAEGLLPFRLMHTTRTGADINRVTDVMPAPFDPVIPRSSPYVAFGQKVYFGKAIEHEILAFTASGKLTTIIRTNDKLEPVKQSQLDDLPSLTGGGAGSRKGSAQPSAQPARRPNLQSTSKTWPSYDRFFVDLSGRLWVQDWIHPLKGMVDSWTAFDSTGKLIGRLNIPAPSERQRRGQVLSFGKDEVFLKRYDADSALHVTAYPLVPRK